MFELPPPSGTFGFLFFLSKKKKHAWQVLHLVLQPHLREAPPGGGCSRWWKTQRCARLHNRRFTWANEFLLNLNCSEILSELYSYSTSLPGQITKIIPKPASFGDFRRISLTFHHHFGVTNRRQFGRDNLPHPIHLKRVVYLVGWWTTRQVKIWHGPEIEHVDSLKRTAASHLKIGQNCPRKEMI